MDMDDVKDELKELLMSLHGEVPENMKQIVQPMYVMTHQLLVED